MLIAIKSAAKVRKKLLRNAAAFDTDFKTTRLHLWQAQLYSITLPITTFLSYKNLATVLKIIVHLQPLFAKIKINQI